MKADTPNFSAPPDATSASASSHGAACCLQSPGGALISPPMFTRRHWWVLCGALAALLLAGAPRLAAGEPAALAAATPGAIEVPLAQVGAMLFADPDARGGRCLAGDVLNDTGRLFALLTPKLDPGFYRVHVQAKLKPTVSAHTARLSFRLAASGGGEGGALSFATLAFAEPGVPQDFSCVLPVRRAETVAAITLDWTWSDTLAQKRPVPKLKAPEPGETSALVGGSALGDDFKLEHKLTELDYYVAADRVWLERVGDVAISDLTTNKVRYRPGEAGAATATIRCLAATPLPVVAELALVRGPDDVSVVTRRELTLAPGATAATEFSFTLDDRQWGHEVRLLLRRGDAVLARADEVFTVHANPWAVAIGAKTMHGTIYGSGNGTVEGARRAARLRRATYGNQVEFVFWGPDDFGGLVPTGEYYSGQMRYHSSAATTKLLLDACHAEGIACAFYSKFCTGGGRAGYDLLRRHPEWLSPSFYDVAQMDRWERSTNMVSWPQLDVRTDQEAAYRHHAAQLVASVKTFGWDMVRYDSDTGGAHVPERLRLIKDLVMKECPGFAWGYNDSVHRMAKPPPGAWELVCENGSMIMDEYNVHAAKEGWPVDRYTNRQQIFRDQVLPRGGYLVFIGFDAPAHEAVYQRVFTLAARIHQAWDTDIPYNRFCTRYAGELWDNQARLLPRAGEWLAWKDAAPLYQWERYVYVRPTGAGRGQLLVNLINAPTFPRFAGPDDATVPPPRRDLSGTLRLPPGVTVRAAWCLTPDATTTQASLATAPAADGRLALTVPYLRFWDLLVFDYEGAWPLAK